VEFCTVPRPSAAFGAAGCVKNGERVPSRRPEVFAATRKARLSGGPSTQSPCRRVPRRGPWTASSSRAPSGFGLSTAIALMPGTSRRRATLGSAPERSGRLPRLALPRKWSCRGRGSGRADTRRPGGLGPQDRARSRAASHPPGHRVPSQTRRSGVPDDSHGARVTWCCQSHAVWLLTVPGRVLGSVAPGRC
jgi:hypothetical protein